MLLTEGWLEERGVRVSHVRAARAWFAGGEWSEPHEAEQSVEAPMSWQRRGSYAAACLAFVGILALVFVTVSSGQNTPSKDNSRQRLASSAVSSGDGECPDNSSSRQYLSEVKKSVYSHWHVEDDDRFQSATLSFYLEPSGDLGEHYLIRESAKSVGAVALRALRAGEPFGALPTGAECLAGRSIKATFTLGSSNPGSR